MKSFWVDTTRMTDGELADLIHELSDELRERVRKIDTGNPLRDQMAASGLEVRSWSTQEQKNHGVRR